MEMRTENSWGGYKRFFLYFGPGGHFLRRGPRTKYNLFRNSEELSPQANPEALLQGTEWRPRGLCCALRTGFQLCVQGVIQAELWGGGGKGDRNLPFPASAGCAPSLGVTRGLTAFPRPPAIRTGCPPGTGSRGLHTVPFPHSSSPCTRGTQHREQGRGSASQRARPFGRMQPPRRPSTTVEAAVCTGRQITSRYTETPGW